MKVQILISLKNLFVNNTYIESYHFNLLFLISNYILGEKMAIVILPSS